MKTVGLWINADKDPGLAVAKELARCFDAAQIRCVALALSLIHILESFMAHE